MGKNFPSEVLCPPAHLRNPNFHGPCSCLYFLHSAEQALGASGLRYYFPIASNSTLSRVRTAGVHQCPLIPIRWRAAAAEQCIGCEVWIFDLRLRGGSQQHKRFDIELIDLFAFLPLIGRWAIESSVQDSRLCFTMNHFEQIVDFNALPRALARTIQRLLSVETHQQIHSFAHAAERNQ